MFEQFTDRAQKVMQLANQEAQRLNHEYIDTEHILLGLVGEGGGVAAHVLKDFGVELRKTTREVERIVRWGSAIGDTGQIGVGPDRGPDRGQTGTIHFALQSV